MKPRVALAPFEPAEVGGGEAKRGGRRWSPQRPRGERRAACWCPPAWTLKTSWRRYTWPLHQHFSLTQLYFHSSSLFRLDFLLCMYVHIHMYRYTVHIHTAHVFSYYYTSKKQHQQLLFARETVTGLCTGHFVTFLRDLSLYTAWTWGEFTHNPKDKESEMTLMKDWRLHNCKDRMAVTRRTVLKCPTLQSRTPERCYCFETLCSSRDINVIFTCSHRGRVCSGNTNG